MGEAPVWKYLCRPLIMFQIPPFLKVGLLHLGAQAPRASKGDIELRSRE